MKLVFLSGENLKDQHFIIDLVHNFKTPEKVLLVHDHFGKQADDTRFVTKRISALLSEEMIVNNAFSGAQRCMISHKDGAYSVRTELISSLFSSISLLILNPVLPGNQRGDTLGILRALRAALPVSELIIFPSNTRSPIAQKKQIIAERSDFDRLIAIYEEEMPTLEMALSLAPATLATPVNFLK